MSKEKTDVKYDPKYWFKVLETISDAEYNLPNRYATTSIRKALDEAYQEVKKLIKEILFDKFREKMRGEKSGSNNSDS